MRSHDFTALFMHLASRIAHLTLQMNRAIA
jgi:hypothetical protein